MCTPLHLGPPTHPPTSSDFVSYPNPPIHRDAVILHPTRVCILLVDKKWTPAHPRSSDYVSYSWTKKWKPTHPPKRQWFCILTVCRPLIEKQLFLPLLKKKHEDLLFYSYFRQKLKISRLEPHIGDFWQVFLTFSYFGNPGHNVKSDTLPQIKIHHIVLHRWPTYSLIRLQQLFQTQHRVIARSELVKDWYCFSAMGHQEVLLSS